MVSLNFVSWNQLRQWLSQVDAFRRAAESELPSLTGGLALRCGDCGLDRLVPTSGNL